MQTRSEYKIAFGGICAVAFVSVQAGFRNDCGNIWAQQGAALAKMLPSPRTAEQALALRDLTLAEPSSGP